MTAEHPPHVGIGDPGPLEYSANDDFDPALLAARAAFEGQWDIFKAGHGYLAVPAGSVVYMAGTVEHLTVKLGGHQEEED